MTSPTVRDLVYDMALKLFVWRCVLKLCDFLGHFCLRMWSSVIETAVYPYREIKQTVKLDTTSSMCCFVTLRARFEATWVGFTARSDFMIYLFIFIFLPFYPFSSSFIFWRPVILYVSCFSPPVFLPFVAFLYSFYSFLPLVLYVLFFISFLLSLYCRLISWFLLASRLNFLIYILVCNLPRNIRRTRLKTSGRNKLVYCDIGYLDNDTCLPFSQFFTVRPLGTLLFWLYIPVQLPHTLGGFSLK
jgi:hypothetical protein